MIVSIATENEAKIVSMMPIDRTAQRTEGRGIYDKHFFNLVVLFDDYHKLGRFVSSLENNSIMFIVESIQINTLGSSDGRKASEELSKIKAQLVISQLFFQG